MSTACVEHITWTSKICFNSSQLPVKRSNDLTLQHGVTRPKDQLSSPKGVLHLLTNATIVQLKHLTFPRNQAKEKGFFETRFYADYEH